MKFDMVDTLGALGLVVITVGVVMVHVPAGVITAGVALIIAAIVGSQGRDPLKKPGG
ncbi:MAG: hypothetical protein RIS45_937 [Planctomycetota bacterium]